MTIKFPQNPALEQTLAFIVEIDRLKSVLRQNYLADGSRRENTAEHSWHIAMAALLCEDYAEVPVDISKVIRLLLVHDLVEIDAGDTFAYDLAGSHTQTAREEAAAQRIFGLLPPEKAQALHALFTEFSENETPEARFALAIDRLMPMIHNAESDGRAWRAHQVTAAQVRKRAESITRGSQVLGEFANSLIDGALEARLLRDSPPKA